MKYKTVKSDLFINGKVIPEGSVLELTDDQVKGLESFLLPLGPQVQHSISEQSLQDNPVPQKKRNKK